MSDKPSKAAAAMQKPGIIDDGWDDDRGWAHNLRKVHPPQHYNFYPPAAAAPVLPKPSHPEEPKITRRHSR